MGFLIVDSRLTYHGVLGRPTLKDLGVVTSIHHLCMEVLNEQGITTIRGDQKRVRKCYLNLIRKVKPRDLMW